MTTVVSPFSEGEPPGPEPSEHLAIAVALNRLPDGARAVQAVVDWLVATVGAEQVLCLARGLGSPDRLVVAGSHGIAAEELLSFSLDFGDLDDPIVKAFARNTEALVTWGEIYRGTGPTSPGLALLVLPLCDTLDEAVGILLVGPERRVSAIDARWLAGLLGPRLAAHQARLAAEAAVGTLSRERELLQHVMNSIVDPILLTDPCGRVITANARAEALFVAPETASEGLRRAVALNSMLFSAALSRRACSEDGTVRQELPLVDPIEGSDLLFELIACDAGAEARVAVLRNVSDLRLATEEIEQNLQKLRLAEAQARAERDRLDLIIDSVDDPIVATDPSGQVIHMNPLAERLLLAPPGQVSLERQRIVRSNDARLSSFSSNLMISGEEQRLRGEIILVDPVSGAETPFEAVVGKIVSDQGELAAIVTVLHDRTEALEKARLYEKVERSSRMLERRVADATSELVHQNELLRRQHIALEEASRLKSLFLANMSHEFRTPLNAILGYTTMLLEGVGGALSPVHNRSLARIDSNAQHLATIISDILDFAKIEAGKIPVSPSRFELPELLTEVTAELDPLIARSNLEVRVQCKGRIGALHSDRPKLKQIVLNLLGNAIKFTPAGSIWIMAHRTRATDSVVIEVKDTGIGIAPEHHEGIFEDFRQVDSSTTRAFPGTGLGLSICRRLAQTLGGRIRLASDVGKGATFTLVVPRKVPRR